MNQTDKEIARLKALLRIKLNQCKKTEKQVAKKINKIDALFTVLFCILPICAIIYLSYELWKMNQ